MKEFGIYSIINKINGKMYIGLTIQDFETRWRQHKWSLNNLSHENDYLQKAWNKYGEDGFEFKVIHLCDELDNLAELERYYIKKYNTYGDGYNLTAGGENTWNELSKEDKNRMINKIREGIINSSDYTIKQIENAKIMLSKGHLSRDVSKKTGLSEAAIHNIKHAKSWTNVRSDLNNKIEDHLGQLKRNENIINDFHNGMTIRELSDKYKLEQSSIRYIFTKHKIPFSEKNKENTRIQREKQLKVDQKFIVDIFYGLSNPTMAQLVNETGFGEGKIRDALKAYKISLSLIKKPKKAKYQSNVQGVRYNESTNRWFAEIGVGNNIHYIGSSYKEIDAIKMRKQAELIIENGGNDGLGDYITSLRQKNNAHYNSDIDMDDEINKYKSLKPTGIRYRGDKGKRFEVYYKKKYIGSSKVLSQAIEIRENYIDNINIVT